MLLRPATLADAAAVAAVYAPYVRDTVISFESVPPDEAEMGARIARTLPRFPWLVVEDARVRGFAYAGAHRERTAYRWSVDVSVYVDLGARRTGLGRQLYGALLGLLGEQGYAQAFAGITLPNPASVGLHEALGFRPVGVFRDVGHKFGSWHDVGWWQRPLRAPADPPAEPVAFGALGPDVVAGHLG